MRLLVLSAALPYPQNDGGRIATLEPLRRLAARGHVLDLLTFGPLTDPVGEALRGSFRRVVAVAAGRPAVQWGRRLASPLARRPWLADRHESPALARAMGHLLDTNTYDLVQVEALTMAAYVPVARQRGLPTVLRTQNVESALCAREATLTSGPRRWHYAIQSRKLRGYEGARCAAVDLCLALTEADARGLRALAGAGARVAVLPAGVDLAAYAPSAEGVAPTVVFTGTLNYCPNADGVTWLLDHVWPRIAAAVPAASLVIVGKDPSRALRRRADGRSIVVTGLVEDVRPWLERATVCVAPLRAGGGMRIKVLQAMAMGKAIVSTSVGAEGIDLEDGRDVLLADTADAFATAVVHALTTPALRDALGRQARATAERHYDWTPIVQRLEAHYHDLVARRSVRHEAADDDVRARLA